MAVQKEIWAQDIASNIFPDNSFYARKMDDGDYLDGRVVNLPQAGGKRNVEKNRAGGQATAVGRTDTVITYQVDEFTTDPVYIKDTEEIEASYQKRMDIMGDDIATLKKEVAENYAYVWAAESSGYIVRTTGGVGNTVRAAQAPGATGNRYVPVRAEWQAAAEILRNEDVWEDGNMWAVIPPSFLTALQNDPDLLKSDKIAEELLRKGVTNQYLGINLLTRSTTQVYDNAGTPVRKAPGAATAATDNQSGMIWNPRFVRGADSAVKVFDREGDPLYYGDVMSTMVRSGGRKRYANGRGVVQIVEAQP